MRHPADIVSIGIGGNDFGFGDIAAACAVNPITGYVFGDGWANYYSTCQAYYDPSGCPSDDTLRARILDVVGPAVEATVAAVRTHSPAAAVFSSTTCPRAQPRPRAGPEHLPGLLLRVADPQRRVPLRRHRHRVPRRPGPAHEQHRHRGGRQCGSDVVSPYAESLSHTACYGTADPWVNGITADLTQRPLAATPGESRLGSSEVQVGTCRGRSASRRP